MTEEAYPVCAAVCWLFRSELLFVLSCVVDVLLFVFVAPMHQRELYLGCFLSLIHI